MVHLKPKLLVLSADRKTKMLTAKRARVSHACSICRKKKRKCDGQNPCGYCNKYLFKCEYSSKKNSEITDSEIIPLKSDNELRPNFKVLTKKIKESRFQQSDFDYRKIIETILSKKTLLKIKNDNPDKVKRNDFIINLLRNNLNDEKMLLNLNFFNDSNKISLPPRDIALRLILKSWNYAGVLFRFYHRPTLIKILDSLYESNGFPKTTEEYQAQSLIYAVLAVGALFSKDDFNGNDNSSREFYNDEGLKFFKKARDLINFEEITDIFSIQTLFMMTIFLQCSASLKSCYYYIGIAKRLALRERLHRKSSLVGPTLIHDESKKRLFWSIYKVDIYLNCILGLPCSTLENNVDQELPLDIDDEKITTVSKLSDFTGTLNDSNRIISSCGMNNEHTNLILIMSRIYEMLYALNLKILEVTKTQIEMFEDDLQKWYINLPYPLKQEYEYKNSMERILYLKPSKLLYLDFLLTKLILYKPFFHFICIDSKSVMSELKFQIAMSHNCVEISKEIIKLSMEIINEDIINGSYWFSIHTIFYSVACLTVYRYQLQIRNNEDNNDPKNDNTEKINDELVEIEKYYKLGYEMLIKLKNNSMASERVFNVLSSIFKEFNEKITELSLQVISSLSHNIKTLEVDISTTITTDSNTIAKDQNVHHDGTYNIHDSKPDEIDFNHSDKLNFVDILFDPLISLEKLLEDLGT